MRPTQRWLLLCALLAVSASPRAAVDTAISGAVFRLQIVTGGEDVAGTATLIHREDRETGAVLHLVTSARLFKDPQGGPPPRIQGVRIFLGAEHALDVLSDDIFVCTGVIDVAVLRATSPTTTLVPQPLVYDPPSPGDVFQISGFGRDGARAGVAERVRFRSTLLAVGDRDASALVGCVGAPAISRNGAFGVVSECTAGRTPTIALFTIARSFIERHVPVSRPSPTVEPTVRTPRWPGPALAADEQTWIGAAGSLRDGS